MTSGHYKDSKDLYSATSPYDVYVPLCMTTTYIPLQVRGVQQTCQTLATNTVEELCKF